MEKGIVKILAKLPKKVQRDKDIWSLKPGEVHSIVSLLWLKQSDHQWPSGQQ